VSGSVQRKSGGKNITTVDISARHLLNIQRITRRKKSAFIRSDLA
jgi:hypothetical protein